MFGDEASVPSSVRRPDRGEEQGEASPAQDLRPQTRPPSESLQLITNMSASVSVGVDHLVVLGRLPVHRGSRQVGPGVEVTGQSCVSSFFCLHLWSGTNGPRGSCGNGRIRELNQRPFITKGCWETTKHFSPPGHNTTLWVLVLSVVSI